MTPDLLPDAALGGVVRPMILQFFVLAVLWIHLVAPDVQGRPGTGAEGRPGGAAGGAAGSDDWTRVLLPFLMLSTGLLFFSGPLQPVWGSLLGPGGERLPAIPAPMARLLVLAMNVGVLGWALVRTGGIRRSPLLPLVVALPPALWLLEGGPGATGVLGTGALVVVIAATVGRTRAAGGAGGHPAPWGAGLGATLLLLGLAAWLGAS